MRASGPVPWCCVKKKAREIHGLPCSKSAELVPSATTSPATAATAVSSSAATVAALSRFVYDKRASAYLASVQRGDSLLCIVVIGQRDESESS
jgi:hypothetical protein